MASKILWKIGCQVKCFGTVYSAHVSFFRSVTTPIAASSKMSTTTATNWDSRTAASDEGSSASDRHHGQRNDSWASNVTKAAAAL